MVVSEPLAAPPHPQETAAVEPAVLILDTSKSGALCSRVQEADAPCRAVPRDVRTTTPKWLNVNDLATRG
jgi:hypothetical protein